MNKALVLFARERKVEAGRWMRTDTTVVESNIHHPLGSWLLFDGVRVLTPHAAPYLARSTAQPPVITDAEPSDLQWRFSTRAPWQFTRTICREGAPICPGSVQAATASRISNLYFAVNCRRVAFSDTSVSGVGVEGVMFFLKERDSTRDGLSRPAH
jgi:hypothetical protein